MYIDASPYALLDESRKNRRELPEEAWQSIHDWLMAKVQELTRLAQLQPHTIGTQCPLCSFILPNGHLLNDLFDHIAQEHQVKIQEVVLGNRTVVVTDQGEFTLESVETF